MPLIPDEKQYQNLKVLGYQASFETFKRQRNKLISKIEKGWDFDTTNLFNGEVFCSLNPKILDGCLFASRFNEAVTTYYNTVLTNQIFNRELSGAFFYAINLMMLASSVETFFHDDDRYQLLLSEPAQYMQKALPTNWHILHDIRAIQTKMIVNIATYFGVKANLMAVKYAIGMDNMDFPAERDGRQSVAYIDIPYIHVVEAYDKSQKSIEDQYIYMDTCINRLLDEDYNLNNDFESFPLHTLAPTEATIKAIVKNRIIKNKPLFMLHLEQMKMSDFKGKGISPEYSEQIKPQIDRLIKYITKHNQKEQNGRWGIYSERNDDE